MQGHSTPTKICRGCKRVLPLADFYQQRSNYNGRHYPAARCRACYADQRRVRYSVPHSRAVIRSNALRRNYGITQPEYDAMLAAQGGVCAICGRPERAVRKGVIMALAIDHQHKPGGQVRGLLCCACNQGLGHFRDDANLLRAAITYLANHPG